MLTFFRRIRRDLLHGDRAAKYLLYAIGEIALVVIGILIALQINNWNEWRKDRISERYYLSQLLKEFEDNYERTEVAILFHEAQISNANLVLSTIKSDSSVNDLEALHFALMQTGLTWARTFNENIWSELNSTGNIGLISNDSLRQAISEFHARAQQIIIWDEEVSDWNKKFRALSGSVLPAKLRINIQAESLGHYQKYSDITEPLISLEPLRNDLREIEGLDVVISDVIIGRTIFKRMLENLKTQSQRILNLINLELRGPD